MVWSPPNAILIPVENVPGTFINPILSDTGKYFRCTSSFDILVTIPLDTTVGFAVGTELKFRQCAAGVVTLVGEDRSPNFVTLHPIEGFLNTTGKLGAVIEAIKVGVNEWDVYGFVGHHI